MASLAVSQPDSLASDTTKVHVALISDVRDSQTGQNPFSIVQWIIVVPPVPIRMMKDHNRRKMIVVVHDVPATDELNDRNCDAGSAQTLSAPCFLDLCSRGRSSEKARQSERLPFPSLEKHEQARSYCPRSG